MNNGIFKKVSQKPKKIQLNQKRPVRGNKLSMKQKKMGQSTYF